MWSDDYTNYSGSITALGSSDGNGGFVETSSLNNLRLSGSADASGGIVEGQWLIDPADVTIGSTDSQVFGNGYTLILQVLQLMQPQSFLP